MRRRSNLSTLWPAAFGCAATLLVAGPPPAGFDPLLFQSPPADARPLTWMHWMNGNASKAGMTRDLESLAEAGVGGALIFSIAYGIPDGSVVFNSVEHRAIIAHSVKEAERLGLKLGVHNCDGWSSSGGPWVTVADSMKRVVWSETVIDGGGAVQAVLPQPPSRLGFYRDIAIVAYPATARELTSAGAQPTLTSSSPGLDLTPLTSRRLDDSVRLETNGTGAAQPWLQLAYGKPFSARSITLEHNSRSAAATLLSSDDGVAFTKVADLENVRTGKNACVFTKTFPLVATRFFRIEFTAPLALNLVDLAPDSRLPGWIGRASMAYVPDDRLPPIAGDAEAAFVPLDRVRVLAEAPGPDGRLTTTLPAGAWRILRFGYTTTGATNHPATGAGQGLECDKLSRPALDRHFAAYLGKIAAENGPLTGKSLRFSAIDSFEMGGQNWTEDFAGQFAAAKGYDLRPFLPLLAGRRLGDAETADAVLRDFRGVVCSLMVENYYRRFTELCHQQGLQSYIEPYGFGPLDNLTVGGTADVPTGEFWLNLDEGTELKSAVSAAHTYGKPVVAAEAFTAWGDLNWKIHPSRMKYAGDFAWTQGINEFMLHRFAHQANPLVAPGMTMGDIGSNLDRTQTWWPNAGKAWLQYVQRGSYLLRQGVPVADVLLYAGEGSPHRVPGRADLMPALPAGYSFDACDTEVLLHRLSVKDGRLVLPEGTSYRVLALYNSDRLSLATLQRIHTLAQAGAIIAGPKPSAPIGHREQQSRRAEFNALADLIWGPGDGPAHGVGRGKVYRDCAWDTIFADLALPPDFTVRGETDTPFTHRRSGASDLYFFVNQAAESRILHCSFRAGGRAPELWQADTGQTATLAQFNRNGDRTELDLPLPAHGSAFVLFREPAPDLDPVVRTELDGAPIDTGCFRLVQGAGRSLTLRTKTNGAYRLTHASGRTREVRVDDIRRPLALGSPWQVSFGDAGRGEAVDFPCLSDWKDHPREEIRHFSGTATYRQSVPVPADWLGPGKRIYLDLGRVEIAAEVLLNGSSIGTLWQPPFIVDVTRWLRPGANDLAIRVTNLWVNRLIGDEGLERTDGYTPDGPMAAWYLRGERPPAGPRSTFTTHDFYDQDRTLVSSGLLGPVGLFQEADQPVPEQGIKPWQPPVPRPSSTN